MPVVYDFVMKRITVREHQTTWDIAIQEYGSVEGFFWIVDDNPEIFESLDVVLRPGVVLKVRDAIINKTVVEYYQINNVVPLSGLPTALEQFALYGGNFDDAFAEDIDTVEDEEGAFNDGFNNGYSIF